ncbi:hypothetical protein [Nonomuraea sp. LPB2021202275-12-8]|uniref:hypothetical protein n=1 Tax=Nonomuraea sp. LPB2021202275-12-8 TaxID=3120159 RepID=UPI00300D51AA
MEITPATVPGVGTVHQCRTRHGGRLAVIDHHDGRRELIVYGPGDSAQPVELERDEADQLAELLHSRSVADRLAAVERRLAELASRAG